MMTPYLTWVLGVAMGGGWERVNGHSEDEALASTEVDRLYERACEEAVA